MAIPEAQLETWAQPLSTAAHLTSLTTVRAALAAGAQLSGKRYEAFLHGSYRNGTVIDARAGVDLIVQLNDSYYDNVSDLPPEHRKFFQTLGPTSASIERWAAFKAAVVKALQAGTDQPVRAGFASIQLAGRAGVPTVEVLAGYQYRRYYTFAARDQRYHEGMVFFAEHGESVIRYPKLHAEQFARKNAKTQDGLKRLVRIIKRLRSSLVESAAIPEGLATSYHIEGLLFNVPDEALASGTLQARLAAALEFLRGKDASAMKAVNGIQPLCGAGEWDASAAQQFIAGLSAAAAP